MKTSMSEEARKLGVSRQLIWQRRKRALGLCLICGKKALKATPVISQKIKSKTIGYCEFHKRQQTKFFTKHYNQHKTKRLAYMKKWYLKNKERHCDYMRLYRRKRVLA